MKYAILMYAAPSHTRGMSGSVLDGIARKHAKLRDELTASGELAGGAGLVLPDETLVLRVGAEPLAREGPLSGGGDDEEHLTAYYEVDCETLDRAKEIGAYVLDHHVTSIEIRRIHDTAEKRQKEREREEVEQGGAGVMNRRRRGVASCKDDEEKGKEGQMRGRAGDGEGLERFWNSAPGVKAGIGTLGMCRKATVSRWKRAVRWRSVLAARVGGLGLICPSAACAAPRNP